MEQLIIESGVITKQQFLKTLSNNWNVKAVDFDSIEIDMDAARLVPEPTARRYLILPFAKSDKYLYTAMARPWDITAIEDLHLRTEYDIKPYLALPSDIYKGLSEVFTQDSKLSDYISEVTKESGEEQTFKEAGKDREEISMDSTTVDDEKKARKVTNGIILEALNKGASDMHIEPFENRLQIRYRIDGQLQDSSFKVSKTLTNAILARIKIMTNSMDITEKRKPQDGRIQIVYKDNPIEFRVNTIPTAYGESCVMRVLDRTSIKVDLPKLGFRKEVLDNLKEVLAKPYGIILVCGPTGSGKSTTLYSALNYILQKSKINDTGEDYNVSPKKILTAENPVEYDLDEIIQTSINPEVGLTFAATMRAFLRQDPDIIMVGEIRDRETAKTAMEAAMTGHLVLSTIHTNDAPTAVARLSEMQVPTYLISSTIEAVLAQRLVRTICPDCRQKKDKISPKLIEEFEKYGIDKDKATIYTGKGCKECGGSGYKGRTGIHELLLLDEEIRELLMTDIAAGPLRKMAIKKGMKPLWVDGLIKVARGKTTYEEILRVSQ
ncbi:MAG: GspE/PulE family protein [Elusimicrobiota bacterium]